MDDIKMTNKQRALLLFNKYSKEYNRFIVAGYIKQGYEEWKDIAIELGKLYKNKLEIKCEYCHQTNGIHKMSCPTQKIEIRL